MWQRGIDLGFCNHDLVYPKQSIETNTVAIFRDFGDGHGLGMVCKIAGICREIMFKYQNVDR
jgi:hypothetical protein